LLVWGHAIYRFIFFKKIFERFLPAVTFMCYLMNVKEGRAK